MSTAPSPNGPWASAPAVAAQHLTRTYGSGDLAVTALHDVSLTLDPGTFTAVVGPSGSGKSTLVHCLAGLDLPDDRPETSVRVGGREITGLSDAELTRFRREHVGFVFQAFNLVPVLTARQNIELPLTLAGRTADRVELEQLADQLGIRERLGHRPDELSGGQQQRVAIARALITDPAVIIADEPTGALDTTATEQVLEILAGAVRERGATVVVVTHVHRAESVADRVLRVADGAIAAEEPGRGARPAAAAGTAAGATSVGGER